MIDAHQHFWRINRNGHHWPTPDLKPIHRDFLPDDWNAVAEPLGIRGSVLVQSQPNDEDTDWLLQVAAGTSAVLAVVGWCDLKASDAPARIGALAAHDKFRGLRPMLQDLQNDAWIDDPALDPAIRAMLDNELRFDALVFTRHLPRLRRFAEKWSGLPIVIDHGAKPPIAAGQVEPWRTEMARLAELPNVYCKLSGLLTEADGASVDAIAPYVLHLCDLFGPERLMWGSDWPVLLLSGSVGQWHRLSAELSGFDEQGLERLFGGTAAQFYGIAQ